MPTEPPLCTAVLRPSPFIWTQTNWSESLIQFVELSWTLWSLWKDTERMMVAKYFATIISRNSHIPKALFHTICSVLDTAVAACPAPTTAICEDFLNFFSTRIYHIQSNISPPSYDPSLVSACSTILNDSHHLPFGHCSYTLFNESIGHYRPHSYPCYS